MCGLAHTIDPMRTAALPLALFAAVILALISGASSGQANPAAAAQPVTNGPLTIIGDDGISTIKSDGSLHTLFRCSQRRGCYELESVDWAPDGRRLAFSVTTIQAISAYNGIHIFNTATRRDRRIFPGADGFDLDWSPDGSRLAYVAYAKFARPLGSIYVIDVDGFQRKLLATGTRGADSSPSWSPSGNRIAFATRRNGRSSISVITLRGEQRKLLVARGSAPAWSPAGGKIAYRSPCGIRLVTPAGKDVTPVGARRCIGIGVAGKPVWSPDGKRIAIQTNRGIYTMNADGSRLALLTSETGRGVLGVGHPTWRPLYLTRGAKRARD
jgi:Tol biopolymer transport system component